MKKESFDQVFAAHLLQIEAVKIRPSQPFTWASGWTSPFYVNNRKLNSYVDIRNRLKIELAHAVSTHFPHVECIAGVATGAISIGALVADLLGLPFVYIRSAKKDHGTEDLIEGEIFDEITNYVVIEDLISTGGSSLKAVKALREHGCNVLGMVALFTYGFPQAIEAFKEADCELVTLTNYEVLSNVAIECGQIEPEEQAILDDWRSRPDTWTAPEK